MNSRFDLKTLSAGVVGLAIGLFLREVFWFGLEGRLSIGDVFNAVITVMVTFFVARIIQVRLENWKIERAILIELVNECIELVAKVHSVYQEGQLKKNLPVLEQRRINLLLRTTSNLLNSLREHCRREEWNKAQQRFIEYKKHLTGNFPMQKDFVLSNDLNAEEKLMNLRGTLLKIKIFIANS